MTPYVMLGILFVVILVLAAGAYTSPKVKRDRQDKAIKDLFDNDEDRKK